MRVIYSSVLSSAFCIFLCSLPQVSFAQAVHEQLDQDTDQNTINQAADTGKQSQDSGKMMNMLAAAALTASCLAPCPKCRMELCAMAALAAMQAANQADASDASLSTFEASKYDPGSSLNPASVPGSGVAGYSDPAVKKAMDKLNEKGYEVTPAGVTFPDGTFQPASAFNSPSSMMAAGMGADAASAAGSALDKINKDIAASGGNVATMALDSAGGFAGGGGSSSLGDLSSFRLPSFKSPFDRKDNKKLLAGKSVMVGGEPIGVKGDDLFDMVHRAYQKKRNKSQFLENSKSFRLPASVAPGEL